MLPLVGTPWQVVVELRRLIGGGLLEAAYGLLGSIRPGCTMLVLDSRCLARPPGNAPQDGAGAGGGSAAAAAAAAGPGAAAAEAAPGTATAVGSRSLAAAAASEASAIDLRSDAARSALARLAVMNGSRLTVQCGDTVRRAGGKGGGVGVFRGRTKVWVRG